MTQRIKTVKKLQIHYLKRKTSYSDRITRNHQAAPILFLP